MVSYIIVNWVSTRRSAFSWTPNLFDAPVTTLLNVFTFPNSAQLIRSCLILFTSVDWPQTVDCLFLSIAVTLPGKMVLVPGASAYLMSVGEVVDHVAKVSFAFDTPPNQPVLLFTFRHFNLPRLNFNTRDFCAELSCILTNGNGDFISDVSCSSRLFGFFEVYYQGASAPNW